MKSQVIKIRNLPISSKTFHSVCVKPKGILVFLLFIGLVVSFQSSYYSSTLVCLVMIPIFALCFMPDWELVRFTQDYLIMFNTRDREQCSIIYWDEILNWQYEWHPSGDLLVVNLIDGSSQCVDMFSKKSIYKYMNLFLPNKEIKPKKF